MFIDLMLLFYNVEQIHYVTIDWVVIIYQQKDMDHVLNL